MVDDPNRETLANFEPGTTEPICQPLKTLESVLSWQPGDDCFNIATQALVKNNVEKKVRPHTLVCHDMAGGYLLDRFVQGADSSEYYRHYHWQYLDSFIYFSHYFVTIPPPGWTNAAHKHGVLMLGTFITEWDDGLERCKAFLKDEDTYKSLADKMVAITKFYNFDGWLVNIENKIEPEKVKNLLGFVEYLTVELHREIPNSKVIWYDSVIEDGSLKWQDQLNDKNRYLGISKFIVTTLYIKLPVLQFVQAIAKMWILKAQHICSIPMLYTVFLKLHLQVKKMVSRFCLVFQRALYIEIQMCKAS
uniref:Cytosolic endo-beta-N-acetylglucosaminidase-like n=1 Tax=Saccoglossus kowalevskii TaxID=10224 RepID=A0ABM0MUP0_SACKO|nr:PREDICTED: cytosolic endo-beta-N-acetylglucosaminidase-like [Saccoglossus kowalevskii]